MASAADKRPTITDVARMAGVSRTTVSDALNGRRYVDARTRQRVIDAARSLGYRPNLRAQRLRTGAAQSIALISSMPFAIAGGPARLGFFMEIVAASAETALPHGFAVILVPPLETTPTLDYLDIDGAIVVEPERDDPASQHLLARGLPIVTIGQQPDAKPAIPYIDMHTEATAQLMLDHLHDQGAHQIAVLTGARHRQSYADMATTYASVAAQRGTEPLLVRVDDQTGEDGGYKATAELLDKHPAIDGICAQVDAFAVGAVHAIHDTGRHIPQDIRVVTRYDGIRARTCRPPLTAINLHLDQLAADAVQLLLEHLHGDTHRGSIQGPPPTLIPRESSLAPTSDRPKQNAISIKRPTSSPEGPRRYPPAPSPKA